MSTFVPVTYLKPIILTLGLVSIVSVELNFRKVNVIPPWSLVFIFENMIPITYAKLVPCLILSQTIDAFSYFAGTFLTERTACGGTKVFKRLSCNKTIEGYISGIASAIIVAWMMNMCSTSVFMICVGSIYGDLFFSSIKRLTNKEDFSNVVPYHGGLHDRIDSTLGALAIVTV